MFPCSPPTSVVNAATPGRATHVEEYQYIQSSPLHQLIPTNSLQWLHLLANILILKPNTPALTITIAALRPANLPPTASSQSSTLYLRNPSSL